MCLLCTCKSTSYFKAPSPVCAVPRACQAVSPLLLRPLCPLGSYSCSSPLCSFTSSPSFSPKTSSHPCGNIPPLFTVERGMSPTCEDWITPPSNFGRHRSSLNLLFQSLNAQYPRMSTPSRLITIIVMGTSVPVSPTGLRSWLS